MASPARVASTVNANVPARTNEIRRHQGIGSARMPESVRRLQAQRLPFSLGRGGETGCFLSSMRRASASDSLPMYLRRVAAVVLALCSAAPALRAQLLSAV